MIRKSSPPEAHQPLNLVVLIATVIIFIFMIILNGMANMPQIFGRMFHNTTAEISDAYPLEITPADWTFLIWSVIYLYQLVIIVYILTTICRRTEGKFMYYSAPYLSPIFFLSYTFNNMCNIAWLVLWDRRVLEYSLLALALMTLSLYLCLFISILGTFQAVPTFVQEGRRRELKAVIGILHNGLGMYAAWLTIAIILNGTIVLTYKMNVPQGIASSIALNSLIGITINYFILDQIVFEKCMRMLFTPYLALLYVLSGIMYRNWNLQNTTTITCLSIAGIGMLLLITKTIRCIYKNWKKPLLPPKIHVPPPCFAFPPSSDLVFDRSDFLY